MSDINFTVTERGYEITEVNKYITMIQQEYANAVAWGEEMERKYEELKKSIDEYGAYIGISANINESALCKVYTFEVADDKGNVVKSHKKYISYPRYDFNLSIEDAKLWYPRGYGEQPLYTLRVLCDERGIHEEKFGIRTVKILQETDKEGSYNFERCLSLKETNFDKIYDRNEEFSSFTLVVNGVKILCMGANWVPCEPFDIGGNEKKITKNNVMQELRNLLRKIKKPIHLRSVLVK
mgnify:CR=1 FL=1